MSHLIMMLSDALIASEIGMFVAKLTSADGLVDKKIFSTHEAACAWLTGEGPKRLEGDVERSELFTEDSKRIWSKLQPKTEDQAAEARCATIPGVAGFSLLIFPMPSKTCGPAGGKAVSDEPVAGGEA
jgi:hypothetical protein